MKHLLLYLLVGLMMPLFSFGQVGYKTLDASDWYKCKKCDTIYVYDSASKCTVQFIHGGAYFEPGVGRMKCDVDSALLKQYPDDPFKYIKNCIEDTAAYRRDRHYYSTIRVFKNKKQIGEVMYGYYREGGCWDANPLNYISQALKPQP